MTDDVVVDASTVILALLGDEPGIRARLQDSTTHAPHLIDAETGSVLRRHELAGTVKPDEAAAALLGARLLVEQRYPHEGAIGDAAWSLRHNLSFYDALYVALATRLGVPLLTADVRMANAPGLTCAVEVV
ncbi:type II toxin-antitoxin system VapC family toxin [Pseudonocardia phyllosphaerae]|uniref:type II toxin-antitoxin system VapC family toxin n=1 Tax=Pseudonocardia phyllosphaerae TaxID=3390502 RepID=UPI00397BBE96